MPESSSSASGIPCMTTLHFFSSLSRNSANIDCFTLLSADSISAVFLLQTLLTSSIFLSVSVCPAFKSLISFFTSSISLAKSLILLLSIFATFEQLEHDHEMLFPDLVSSIRYCSKSLLMLEQSGCVYSSHT